MWEHKSIWGSRRTLRLRLLEKFNNWSNRNEREHENMQFVKVRRELLFRDPFSKARVAMETLKVFTESSQKLLVPHEFHDVTENFHII